MAPSMAVQLRVMSCPCMARDGAVRVGASSTLTAEPVVFDPLCPLLSLARTRNWTEVVPPGSVTDRLVPDVVPATIQEDPPLVE